MKVRHSQPHRTQNGEPLKLLWAHSTHPPGLFRVKVINRLWHIYTGVGPPKKFLDFEFDSLYEWPMDTDSMDSQVDSP